MIGVMVAIFIMAQMMHVTLMIQGGDYNWIGHMFCYEITGQRNMKRGEVNSVLIYDGCIIEPDYLKVPNVLDDWVDPPPNR